MKSRKKMAILAIVLMLLNISVFSGSSLADTLEGSQGGVSWSYDTETKKITFSGSGRIFMSWEGDPRAEDERIGVNRREPTSIEIQEGITSISGRQFQSCENVVSLEISNSVTDIEIDAFNGCIGLQNVKIPNSVTTIARGAFSSCENLKSIEIPSSVTSIGEDAFWLADDLTIYCEPNSTARQYAQSNGIKYADITSNTTDGTTGSSTGSSTGNNTGSNTGSNTGTPTTGYDWTDASGWDYELIKDGNNNNLYKLKFSNVSKKEQHTYTLWMSNSESDMLEEDVVISKSIDRSLENAISMLSDNSSSTIDEWLEKSGDIYFQIVDEYRVYDDNGIGKDVAKVVRKKTKLDRPEYKLTTRISHIFSNSGTATYVATPNATNNAKQRKVKVKIGKITDASILSAIKNSESGCLDKLLEYAKKTDSVYETTIAQGDTDSITSKANLINKEYYYVYSVLENEDGKYFDIEDVGLYQASAADIGRANLWSYLDKEFVWNLSTAEQNYSGKKESTEADNLGPQAGESLLIAIAIVVVGGISVVGYRKYRNIKIK